MGRERTLLFLACACAGCGGSAGTPRAEIRAGSGAPETGRTPARAVDRSSPSRPSVVLVVMDTLRADRLSTYGHARATSPALTGLAERGTLFENGYSTSSWTWPATASLLTGLTPMEHGLSGEGSSSLDEQVETLAESLQRAGFTTAAWSGNPLVSAAHGLDQGFERFRSLPGLFQKTETFFDEVRAFLRESAGSRFFLYLHLTEVHGPLRPLDEGLRLFASGVPPGFRAKCDGLGQATGRGQALLDDGTLALDGIVTPEERAWVEELYDACVWSGDHWLGELLAELAALGLDDETVVAFTSDHGEELLERGSCGHGQSLHRELVRVPLVIAGPGVPAGKRREVLVSTRIVVPLLARLAGVPFAGGEAAKRVLDGLEPSEDVVLFSTTKGSWKGRGQLSILGLTDGQWMLHLAPRGAPWGEEPGPEGDVELFRIADDPYEREDLASFHPAEVRRLRALLLERMQAFESRHTGASIAAGGDTLRLLQRLGYAGEAGETR